MAKTGGWCKKLMDKQRANATNHKLGRTRALITRTKSTYDEKRIALKEHNALIASGVNPGCSLTYISKTEDKRDVIFHGDGLPNEGYHARTPTTPPKPKQDTRNSIKSEAVKSWRPRPFGAKRFGCVNGSYLAR